MRLPNLIHKTTCIEDQLARFSEPDSLVLNIGSSSKRHGSHCINLDVQAKHGVDIIADAHNLPLESSIFDICILSAVLQYCRNPAMVVQEVYRVLKVGGYVIVDAPFIQAYCPDAPDLYRFTKEGLEYQFGDCFEIIESQVSIPGSSALAHFTQSLILYVVKPRWLRGVIAMGVSVLLYPLARLKFGRTHEVSGATMLVARKIK